MVGADAHGAPLLLALLHERREGVVEELALGEVLLVRLVDHLLERLPPVHEVARVDPDLLDGVGHRERHLGLEVHVGAERDVVALGVELLADLEARLRVLHPDHRHAHQVEALVCAALHLLYRRVHVGRQRGRHGLADERMLRAELNRAGGDRARLPPDDPVQVLAVLRERAELPVAWRQAVLLRPRRRRPLALGVGPHRRTAAHGRGGRAGRHAPHRPARALRGEQQQGGGPQHRVRS
mmetsp:Transcript_11836/g.20251  ORF Transcript_11836/g.20251 Transcript_11836/m.20251 type:complete len:239 (+) Transcript_11836:1943-2659(+)